jgi:hypothetical protein
MAIKYLSITYRSSAISIFNFSFKNTKIHYKLIKNTGGFLLFLKGFFLFIFIFRRKNR